jgi:membrane protein
VNEAGIAASAPSRAQSLTDFGRRAADIARQRVPGAPAVVESFERERAAGSVLLAGGLAYRFFLWLVPFGLVLAALASEWSAEDPRGLRNVVQDYGLAGAAANSALAAVRAERHSRWYFLAAGVTLLLWFGMSAVRALRVAYTIAWADESARLHRPLRASVIFTGFVVGVTFIGFGTRYIGHEVSGTWGVIALLAMFGVYAAVAGAALNLLPHGGASWTALLPGVLVIGVGMQLMHIVVAVYLAPRLAHSPSLYGSLGAATVIMLWLYLIARLFVSAAFLNATLWQRKHSGTA